MNELEIPLEYDLYGFVVADKHQDLCCSREGYQKFCHLLAGAPDLLIVTALMTVAISYTHSDQRLAIRGGDNYYLLHPHAIGIYNRCGVTAATERIAINL